MRISDWSSDVCSSDLVAVGLRDGEAVFLVLQLAEEIQRSLAGNARLVEKACARLIGRAFLRAGKGAELAHRRLLTARHDRHCRIWRSEERRVGNECVSTCRSR